MPGDVWSFYDRTEIGMAIGIVAKDRFGLEDLLCSFD